MLQVKFDVFYICFFFFGLQINIIIPVLFIIVSIFLIAMPMLHSPYACLMGLLVTFAGAPVYLICVASKNKPRIFTSSLGKTINKYFFNTERIFIYFKYTHIT